MTVPEPPSLPPKPPSPLRIRIRRPRPVQDDLPEVLPPLKPDSDSDVKESEDENVVSTPGLLRRVVLIVRDGLTTAANTLGLYRTYLHRPTFDPDHFVPPHDLAKSTVEQNDFLPDVESSDEEGEYLHKNRTFSLLSEWQFTGSNEKSNAEMDRLVNNVFSDPNFDLEDARRFKAQRVANEIDKNQEKQKDRSPAFAHPLAAQFHFSPYKLFHQPESGERQRVYSEVYDSDAFIKEHDDVQNRAKNPPEDPDCKHEKVVAALMFWSDSTHLTNFGTAKLWPIYMALGNLSKYIRAMPDVGALQHVAYIPSLPDSFQTELGNWHAKFSKSKQQQKDILTHCRRELMHAVWRMLLDDEFLHAYTYGIVINRVTRVRTYLWDKVVAARRWLYEKGKGIKSVFIEQYLKESSSVPTVNAFVDRLGRNFDLTRMLAPDLMHELELGVWKALFTHLVRVLYAAASDGSLVRELDERFRRVSTFGNGTIRNFSNNTSEMKKLAARDFEDILQCSIPVFDGLLPDEHDNRAILKLLYRTAEFHAFAKLRMHTDKTLSHLESLTVQFGKEIRHFRDNLCPRFDTVELPGEAERRGRQQLRQNHSSDSNRAQSSVQARGRRKKELNLNTIKFHSLGDYVRFIRLYGGMDSFSTQTGELAHRLVKRLYGRTNKRAVEKQIGNRVQRLEHARLALLRREHRLRQQQRREVVRRNLASPNAEDDAVELENQNSRFFISQSQNRSLDLFKLVKENRGNPAYENFIRKLKDHLLGRRLGRRFDGDDHNDFTHEDRNTISLYGNRIFEVGTCHINFTTYDNRRDSNVINPKTHPDVMVLSQDDREPFWWHFGGGIGHQSKSRPTDISAEQEADGQGAITIFDDDNDTSHDDPVTTISVELELQEIDRRLEEMHKRGDDGETDYSGYGEASGVAVEEEESEGEDMRQEGDEDEDGEDELYKD
ncbi:hypothetical protein H1R20_g12890, partial [Candolleomyces eurysporus]